MQDINPQQHQPEFLPHSTIRWGRMKSGGEIDQAVEAWVRDTNSNPIVSEYYRRAGWTESADLCAKAEKMEAELQTGQQVPREVSDLRDLRKGLADSVEVRVKQFEGLLKEGRIVALLYRESGKKFFAVRTSESIYATAQVDIRTETLFQAAAQIMVKYTPTCPTTNK